MAKYNILIINGPNLGRLGERQPDIYGSRGMETVSELLPSVLGGLADDTAAVYFQSNSEGLLIDRLERAHDDNTTGDNAGRWGVAFNPGAYTHTSLAISDCLAWIDVPVVEVHLSNVYARVNPMRHKSLTAKHCIGVISGFGIDSYLLAVQALVRHMNSN